jgi:hypothetical protein
MIRAYMGMGAASYPRGLCGAPLVHGLVLWGAGVFPGLASGQGVGETDPVEEVPIAIPADLLEPTLQSRLGPGDRLARMISADLRHLEARQSEIISELDGLPQSVRLNLVFTPVPTASVPSGCSWILGKRSSPMQWLWFR